MNYPSIKCPLCGYGNGSLEDFMELCCFHLDRQHGIETWFELDNDRHEVHCAVCQRPVRSHVRPFTEHFATHFEGQQSFEQLVYLLALGQQS